MAKTLILTDNPLALGYAQELSSKYGEIDIFQSPSGSIMGIPKMRVRDSIPVILRDYGLVISLHCKQIFPTELVRQVRCVNIHPGFNPYNRGWFPHVFSIINGLKSGVTIHEMDESIDHGEIIVQRECEITSWDTSGSVYKKLMELEHQLLMEFYTVIRDGLYSPIPLSEEGNINYKKDFEAIKSFDLAEKASFREFIDRLRALTHDEYQNAYFIDDAGRKILMKIILVPDKQTGH